jgi:phage tail protein X
MASKGVFGKVFDRIKDRFDGEDSAPPRQADSQVSGHVPGVGTVGAPAPSIPGVGTVEASTPATAERDAAPAPAGTLPPTPPDTSDHGQVIGQGVSRQYVTRAGDTLEAIGAYFYGDATHAQRLRDDNPQLATYRGPLPGGLRLNVGEDASRGDTLATGGE